MKIGPDGTVRVYDPVNNIFGAYNTNGTTKTFYKPDTNLNGYPDDVFAGILVDKFRAAKLNRETILKLFVF